MKLNLFLTLISFFALNLAQQYPLNYNCFTTYIDENYPSTFFGDLDYALVDKNGRRTVILCNLDQPYQLKSVYGSKVEPDIKIDCNHWDVPIEVSLTVQLESVSNCNNQNGCELILYKMPTLFSTGLDQTGVTWNCPNDLDVLNNDDNCPMGFWDGGCYSTQSQIDSVQVFNGQVGEISFDITNFANKLNTDSGYDVAFILISKKKGHIILSSNETKVQVTNPVVPVEDLGNRYFKTVNGLNMSYVIHCENYPISNGVMLLFSPKPGYSYGQRGTADYACEVAQKRVYVFDYVGSGYSDKPTDLNIFNYDFSNQTIYLETLISSLNIVSPSNPSLVWCQEIGCMIGINFARRNPTLVNKIALNVLSYISTCPYKYSMEANNSNPEPNFGGGFGICQNESLVPFSFWPTWAFFQSGPAGYAAACYAFVHGPDFGFLNPSAYANYMAYPPSPGVVDNYLLPYPGANDDVNCTGITIGEVEFPLHAPAPVVGMNPDSLMILDAINEYFRTSTVSKLFYYNDCSPFTPIGQCTSSVQISRIKQIYSNSKSVCVGIGSGHLVNEDLPIGIGMAVGKFSLQ